MLAASILTLAGGASAAPPGPPPAGPGYRLLSGDGGIFAFSSPFEGSAASDPTRCPANPPGRTLPQGSCWSMASTAGGGGYYILNAVTGEIFPFGDAVSYGEPAGTVPYSGGVEFSPTAVAIALTADGGGYWVLEVGGSGLGSVQGFGDAAFYGDETTAHVAHNGAPVGLVGSLDGKGYLIVDSDGGVFAFGDAVFEGSAGGRHLNAPVVAIARSASGTGYWLAAADGGVFAFGDAVFGGSMGGVRLQAPVVGITAQGAGPGYWLAAADGGVFALGGAPFLGSMGGRLLARPVVAIAP